MQKECSKALKCPLVFVGAFLVMFLCGLHLVVILPFFFFTITGKSLFMLFAVTLNTVDGPKQVLGEIKCPTTFPTVKKDRLRAYFCTKQRCHTFTFRVR